MKRMSLVFGGLLLGTLAVGPAQAQRPELSNVSRLMTVDGIVVSYNSPNGVIQMRRADGRLDYIELGRARVMEASAGGPMAEMDAVILPESRIQVIGFETPRGLIAAREVRITGWPQDLARVIPPTEVPPVRIAATGFGRVATPVNGVPVTPAPRQMVAGARLETSFDPAERLAEATAPSFHGSILTDMGNDSLFRGQDAVGFTATVVSIEQDPNRIQLSLPSGSTVWLRNDGASMSGVRNGERLVIRATQQDGLWTVQSVTPL